MTALDTKALLVGVTPGDWELADDFDCLVTSIPTGAMIGRAFDSDDFPCIEPADAERADREAQANARLIASAPRLARRVVELEEALEEVRKRFQMITDFGDPYEINDEPEDFGGTDDGTETVCMAYENMQCIAENALRSIDAALTIQGEVK